MDLFTSFWVVVKTLFGYFGRDLLLKFLEFLNWMIDPATWVRESIELAQWLLTSLGSAIGGDVGDSLANIGGFLQVEIFDQLYSFTLYVISPFIDAALVQLCVTAIFLTWVMAYVAKWLSWILSKVWSGQA